tara:strand:- start:207 stop:389 length:183 start_codon:yes stop_codon:yes gene_type:complete
LSRVNLSLKKQLGGIKTDSKDVVNVNFILNGMDYFVHVVDVNSKYLLEITRLDKHIEKEI